MGRRTLLVIIAALGVAGCPSSDPRRVGECTTRDDCEAGESCLDNVCVPRDAGVEPGVDAGPRDGGRPPDAGPADCATDGDCDDGVFCDGVERCVAGRCAAGDAVDCGDTVACTADVCDEGADECVRIALDERCDDGMWCTGTETCDAEAGCIAGAAPDCADTLDCTADDCDEAADACRNVVAAGSCAIDGACHADGATDAGDFCRACDAATSPRAWVVSCTGSVTDDTFDDFRAGSLGRSAANLYVHASGSVQSVHRADLDRDGFVDLLQTNYYDGTTRRTTSTIHRGSATGLDPARATVELPTVGALASASADLDADGYVDLVFANHYDDASYTIDSYVYWGSATGWSATDRTSLATLGSWAVAVADLDRDGWLDLVFSNYYDGTRYNTSSYVYWGSATGYSAADRLSIPTEGSIDLCVADLDGDEHLELISIGYYNCGSMGCGTGGYTSARVRIFRGTATGPSTDAATMTHLPAQGGRGCAIADLDRDGDLDLLLVNHYNGTTGSIDSRIFWGEPAMPFDVARSTTFPTSWASHASIADVDGNGWLDYAIPMAYDGSRYTTASRIYYRGMSGVMLTEFYPTVGSYDVELLDWSHDDRIDVLFAGHYDGARYTVENRYYAGAVPRPAGSGPVAFPGRGTLGFRAQDWGHTWDRGWVETFVSRAHDLGGPMTATWLDVAATVPAGTTLRISVRSADDAAGLAAAAWGPPHTTWPARLEATHAGRRFVQWRAELDMPRAADSPILDRVRIHYR